MKYARRILHTLLMAAMLNYIPLFVLICFVSGIAVPFTFWCWLPLLAAFFIINVHPLPKTAPTKRIQRLAEGT